MPKYNVTVTADDGESAENLLKVIATSVETNPSLNLENVRVEPVPTPDPEQPFQSDADYRKGTERSA